MRKPFHNFLDVLEAADHLHIHPESVRRLVRRGDLPAFKFANKWLIERKALERFARKYDGRPGARPGQRRRPAARASIH